MAHTKTPRRMHEVTVNLPGSVHHRIRADEAERGEAAEEWILTGLRVVFEGKGEDESGQRPG